MRLPVTIKQILIYNGDTMFLVDAAGSLWCKRIADVMDEPAREWAHVTLPEIEMCV
jgi:hypothetical protein